MDLNRININTNINVYVLDANCFDCDKELDFQNVELFHRGYGSAVWQKEKIGYCKDCNKYYISFFKKDVFSLKYPDYYFLEKGESIPRELSDFTCNVLSKKNKHATCCGRLRREPYIKEKVFVMDSDGKKLSFILNKCPICNEYFVNNQQAKEISKVYSKARFIKLLNEKSKNAYYKSFSSAGMLGLNDKLNVVYDNKCLGKHDISSRTFKVSARCTNKMSVIKELNGYYCNTCKMYIIDQDDFDNIIGEKIPNCDFYVNYKKYDSSKYHQFNINSDFKAVHSVDFFVRTNVIGCINDRHNIESLIAEIDVIDKLGNVVKKSLPAYYCRECDLYFIYNNEYERIRNTGIPLCQIYEYTKYIKGLDNEFNLNQESILHSFGYNVGVTENLSEEQRRHILSFIISNGIMDKHEIISLLNYFIDMRKSNSSQFNAIKKWQSDIDYLKEININIEQKVKINSIKIINRIERI